MEIGIVEFLGSLLAASGVPSSLIIYLIMRFQRVEAKIETIERFVGLDNLTIDKVQSEPPPTGDYENADSH